MFSTITIIKKNKIGNYVKNIKEHYIRDDIYCGIKSCEICIRETESNLSETFINKNERYKYNHYIILDTNVILRQIDILEEEVLGNVIILHTVLKEVKHRSLPIYKRLMSIIDNASRHFYIFTNDHHQSTYLKQNSSESPNGYNDRCIRAACSWYMSHLPEENFILITNDAENRNIAMEENIEACSIERYVKSIKDIGFLIDKLSQKEFSSTFDAEDFFPPHKSTVEIVKGIKDGSFLQGVFQASSQNFLEGTVNIEQYDEPIIVQGRAGLNRAVHGDIVAVELFKKEEWANPSEIIYEDEGNQDGINDVLEKERELLKESHKKQDTAQPTGRIVGIIRRKWRQYCGILQPGGIVDAIFHNFVPADKRIPKIRIETRQAEFLRTQKFIVAMDSWSRNSRYPSGHYVRALGKIGEQTTENEVILLEHDVPHSKFSEEVLSFLPKLPWTITDEDVAVRTDLRHLDVCSVDPPGCTDIDDALHCRSVGDNHLEVGVHIADVTHFIRPNNALDLEAASRATTVYLVDNRIDMVPELLSSNLCSLRGGEERFAFSCIWEMDKDANIVNTRFHKSIIKSRRAMTYEEAQMIIDDTNLNDSIAKSLRNLNALAKILKKQRMDNGALVLASPEVKIQMDNETHDPIDVEVKKFFETNSMVEEFMLLANISVAEKIVKEFPDCAMLRRHPVPQASNFDPLIKAGKHLGFDIQIDTGKKLAKSLDDAVHEENTYLNTMLRMIATRCMLQAVYFPSGTLRREEFYHYGLAVPLYTHFTSPIRRYADIVVHRLLAAAIGADSTYAGLLDKHKASDLCTNLNYRNRMAQYAGRASVAFNTHLFFKGKLQDEEGYILFVKKNALQILLPKYGIECTLYLGTKEENKFSFNEEDHTQTCGGVVLHAFDPVTVRLTLDSNNIQHEKFVLQLVKPYIEGFSIAPLDSSDPNKKRQVASKGKSADDGNKNKTKKLKKSR